MANKQEEQQKKQLIGHFYVSLTAKMFGGEPSLNGGNNHDTGNPDVINWQRSQYYESKASISSDCHKVSPEQIIHYSNLLLSSFPLDNPEAYYFFWEYRGRGITQFDFSTLEKHLAETTSGLLILSFDIIEAYTRIWSTTGSRGWPVYYMFRASERRQMKDNTTIALAQLGLDYRDYRIRPLSPKKRYKYKHTFLPKFNMLAVEHNTLKGVELR